MRNLINRSKQKTDCNSIINKRKKAVVKEETHAYVWSIFTLDAVLYYTSKESLEEEANKILELDKDKFFIKTVHVD